MSCMQGKENKSGREAINILSDALEILRPSVGDENHGEESKGTDNISALLANEVKDLKDKRKEEFTVRLLGVNSLIYIEQNFKGDPSPSALVDYVVRQAYQTGQNKAKLCNRFYPVEYTCGANLGEIEKLSKVIAKDHFEGKDTADKVQPIKFSVDLEKRAAPPGLDRMEIIKAFASAIEQPPHSVDLDNPEKTILVNVTKGNCAAAVVRDYRTLCKMNLRAASAAGLKLREEEKAETEDKKTDGADETIDADEKTV